MSLSLSRRNTLELNSERFMCYLLCVFVSIQKEKGKELLVFW